MSDKVVLTIDGGGTAELVAFDGNHVAVEIRVRMNGADSPLADFFTLDQGLITRLVIYSGPSEA